MYACRFDTSFASKTMANDLILVKQEQVWESISKDEEDDVVLLSVETPR